MDFRVASVFSDNMVLQRDKRVVVFGEAEDGTVVSVSFLGQEVSTTAENGRFKLWLEPMSATVIEGIDIMRCGSDMVVTAELHAKSTWVDEESNDSTANDGDDVNNCSGANAGSDTGKTIRKIFKNVVVGEVWLAGGQSNMEYELQNMIGGEEILKQRDDLKAADEAYSSHVRFYYTQKKSFIDEEFLKSESETRWEIFTDEGVKVWSAVGFLYARQLAEKLGVIVGVVGCNWGGTSASHWIDRESILSDGSTRIYVDEFDEKIKGKSAEEQKAEYDKYTEHITWWDAEAKKIWAVRPDASWDELIEKLGPNQWPGPPCIYMPFRPSGLYECMISRIMPYTLRGVIYYQGESDDHRPEVYYKLFSILIRKWREYFEDEKLPFIHVQLPCNRYGVDPDWKNWCPIRDAQMKVYKEGLADGIAVAIDCGEFNEIHPKDKRAVADRLAMQALYAVYGLLPEKDAFGPILRDVTICDTADNDSKTGSVDEKGSSEHKLILSFDHAEQGFVIKNYNHSELPGAHETDILNNDGIIGFEIAGEDKEFTAAHVEISDSEIILSSDKVPEPKYARYLWTNYGTVSLYGAGTGIPMAPFNTAL